MCLRPGMWTTDSSRRRLSSSFLLLGHSSQCLSLLLTGGRAPYPKRYRNRWWGASSAVLGLAWAAGRGLLPASEAACR